jgi:toxin FitB
MIVLDTKVLSEPLSKTPSQKVLDWLDNQAAETLYITTITYAELRYGVEKLPEGKRKKELAARIERVLDLFKDRTLAFDIPAAEQLARIAARAARAGKRATAPDAYIAAIAGSRGFAVATRNVKHFDLSGVALVNPWEWAVSNESTRFELRQREALHSVRLNSDVAISRVPTPNASRNSRSR